MDAPRVEAIAQIAGDIIAAVGLFAVWYQVRDHKSDRKIDWARELASLEADHDRRKKQATIEYVNRVRNEWRGARRVIRTKLGSGPITEAKLATLDGTTEADDKIRELLAGLEDFSAGANAQVFDANLIDSMCGSFLIGVHDDFGLFIKEAQKTYPTNYTEFERLVDYLRGRRKQPSS